MSFQPFVKAIGSHSHVAGLNGLQQLWIHQTISCNAVSSKLEQQKSKRLKASCLSAQHVHAYVDTNSDAVHPPWEPLLLLILLLECRHTTIDERIGHHRRMKRSELPHLLLKIHISYHRRWTSFPESRNTVYCTYALNPLHLWSPRQVHPLAV